MAPVFDRNYAHFGSRVSPSPTPWRLVAEFCSEFVGTLLFAFFGGFPRAGAAGNGAVLAALVFCTATVSGGKLNPAVSLAAALTSGSHAALAASQLIIEWTAQLTGAFAGAAVLRSVDAAATCFAPPPGTSQYAVMWAEAFITALLVLTMLSTAVEEEAKPRFAAVAALAIGLSLYAGAVTAGELTGGAANPARFLAAAVLGHNCPQRWKYGYSYILGELLGCLAAAVLHIGRDAARLLDTAHKAARRTTSPLHKRFLTSSEAEVYPYRRERQ
jgi:glycerol uptake facilitator-like aquaporin